MSILKMPGVTARASAVLAAAGAYDATGNTLPVPSYDTVSFWPDYTPGASGGAFALIIEVSRDGTTWYPAPIADSALAESGTTATVTNYGMAVKWPVTAGTSLLNLAPLRVDVRDVMCVRCRAAEYGVTATPGTLAVTETATRPL